MIRAIEVFEQTGLPLSSFQKNKKRIPKIPTLMIGLDLDRTELYDRINIRVDTMVKNGLVDEARSLYNQRHLNALQTVGYSELFEYFDGTSTLDNAIDLIKRNTRRYAKRQLTWLRKYQEIYWIQPDKINKMVTLIDKYID